MHQTAKTINSATSRCPSLASVSRRLQGSWRLVDLGLQDTDGPRETSNVHQNLSDGEPTVTMFDCQKCLRLPPVYALCTAVPKITVAGQGPRTHHQSPVVTQCCNVNETSCTMKSLGKPCNLKPSNILPAFQKIFS